MDEYLHLSKNSDADYVLQDTYILRKIVLTVLPTLHFVFSPCLESFQIIVKGSI